MIGCMQDISEGPKAQLPGIRCGPNRRSARTRCLNCAKCQEYENKDFTQHMIAKLVARSWFEISSVFWESSMSCISYAAPGLSSRGKPRYVLRVSITFALALYICPDPGHLYQSFQLSSSNNRKFLIISRSTSSSFLLKRMLVLVSIDISRVHWSSDMTVPLLFGDLETARGRCCGSNDRLKDVVYPSSITSYCLPG